MFSLNPIKWVKSAISSQIEDAIDGYVTIKNGKEYLVLGVNTLIAKTEKGIDDKKVAKISNGLICAGEGLVALGEAVSPSGAEGRKVTAEELDTIMAKLEDAFGTLITDAWVADKREWLKDLVRTKLGL